jgi:hypothetical protein
LGWLWPCPQIEGKARAWLERLSKGKPSSLLGLVVSDEGKKFYDIDTRLNAELSFYYNYFFVVITFVLMTFSQNLEQGSILNNSNFCIKIIKFYQCLELGLKLLSWISP